MMLPAVLFQSPLNIHKMSQVICHHSWVLVWPWENLSRSLSVGPPPIGYSPNHMESLWMPPVSQTSMSMLPKSHMCRVLFKGSQPMSAFSTYPFFSILAIPSVKLVRDRSSISLVIILTLGSRSKTPIGFWHFSHFVTSLGYVYHTTCHTDIGIGELVIHFTLWHGSTLYCSWP